LHVVTPLVTAGQGVHVDDAKQPDCGVLPEQMPEQRCSSGPQLPPPELDELALLLDALLLDALLLDALVLDDAFMPPMPPIPAPPLPPAPPSPT